MSSTNKTTNYKLSQYVGTDKPTYLGDYNGDMLKIDTQMKANADAASNAQEKAGEAVTKAEQAQTNITNVDSRLTSAETDITQLQSNVTNMSQNIKTISDKADAANTAASGAQQTANTATSEITKINQGVATWYGGQVTLGGGLVNNGFYVYENQYLNLLNVYGSVGVVSPSTVGKTIVLGSLPSGVRKPSSNRGVSSGASIATNADGGGRLPVDLTIDTNGTISVDNPTSGAIYAINFQCLLNEAGWF